MTDEERIAKVVADGWEDEDFRLVRLTENQALLVGEDLMARLQGHLGSNIVASMEVPAHITLLPDGVVIIESHGRIEI